MNIGIFVIAVVWAYLYNSYFGWNWSSQSVEEVICDGIFAIIIAMSLIKN